MTPAESPRPLRVATYNTGEFEVADSGVYWPTRDDPHAYLNQASDHHLVWIDLVIQPE